MSINEHFGQEEIELLTEAIKTQDVKRLKALSESVYMNVRKAVSRNRFTNSNIINKMVESERASSVVYWLMKHPGCQTRKTLPNEDLNNKCVVCDINELDLYSACMKCTK